MLGYVIWKVCRYEDLLYCAWLISNIGNNQSLRRGTVLKLKNEEWLFIVRIIRICSSNLIYLLSKFASCRLWLIRSHCVLCSHYCELRFFYQHAFYIVKGDRRWSIIIFEVTTCRVYDKGMIPLWTGDKCRSLTTLKKTVTYIWRRHTYGGVFNQRYNILSVAQT